MQLVSIITVNYKQPRYTTGLLQSIVRHVGMEQLEVIVVDNGATADHGELFRSVCPDVVYVRSEKNLGFAGGNNLGTRYAKGDYLLFLNNDTEITPGFIETRIPNLIR